MLCQAESPAALVVLGQTHPAGWSLPTAATGEQGDKQGLLQCQPSSSCRAGMQSRMWFFEFLPRVPLFPFQAHTGSSSAALSSAFLLSWLFVLSLL